MNFDLHNRRSKLGASLIEFIRFLPWKTLETVSECWKFSNVCLMIPKVLGLSVLLVEMKGITSFAHLFLGFLSSFNGIYKALSMLFSIKAIWCFCSLIMFLALKTVLVTYFLLQEQYRCIYPNKMEYIWDNIMGDLI